MWTDPILQESAVDVEVEQNADPELDDIVSPRLNVMPNDNESVISVPDSDGDEEWELTSCSTSTAPDGDDGRTEWVESEALSVVDGVDGIETMPQRVTPPPIDVHHHRGAGRAGNVLVPDAEDGATMQK